ncbi:hypothetical protein VP01_5246g1 [Puccinia sorghi]|uniref:Uncharacterized protein n=1 Tax=Puccinia sorghi TaxID=27349 RepID=A0A0L6UKH3_9BASI|nr:hypothetical protein VP01_5246g1 [Puccinia sorghi]
MVLLELMAQNPQIAFFHSIWATNFLWSFHCITGFEATYHTPQTSLRILKVPKNCQTHLTGLANTNNAHFFSKLSCFLFFLVIYKTMLKSTCNHYEECVQADEFLLGFNINLSLLLFATQVRLCKTLKRLLKIVFSMIYCLGMLSRSLSQRTNGGLLLFLVKDWELIDLEPKMEPTCSRLNKISEEKIERRMIDDTSASVWSLGREAQVSILRIGMTRTDDFFTLSGHSLKRKKKGLTKKSGKKKSDEIEEADEEMKIDEIGFVKLPQEEWLNIDGKKMKIVEELSLMKGKMRINNEVKEFNICSIKFSAAANGFVHQSHSMSSSKEPVSYIKLAVVQYSKAFLCTHTISINKNMLTAAEKLFGRFEMGYAMLILPLVLVLIYNFLGFVWKVCAVKK